ncbi:MAG: GNAT family N-acetyltransferase [Rhizomicrobium sp.]|nr:GNAT family N-acetyltransferase [Rhizomicrobium sp.]
MSITIRSLSEADFPLVVALAYQIWPVAYGGNLTPEQLENLLSRIYCVENLQKEVLEGHCFWAAFDGDEALGFASGYRKDATIWIKKLYVLPEVQGRGVGRALMQTVIDAFTPAREVRLFVNGQNRAAQVFYERCGFTNDGAVEVQMGDFRFSDYVYAKALPSTP